MQNFRAYAEIRHAKFVNLLSAYVIAALLTMSQYRGGSPNPPTICPSLIHAEMSGTNRSDKSRDGAANKRAARLSVLELIRREKCIEGNRDATVQPDRTKPYFSLRLELSRARGHLMSRSRSWVWLLKLVGSIIDCEYSCTAKAHL
jgi:hypothetical protein